MREYLEKFLSQAGWVGSRSGGWGLFTQLCCSHEPISYKSTGRGAVSKQPSQLYNRTPADDVLSHKAIIAYLTSVKLPGSAAALRQELEIGDTFDDATSKKYEGLLEKKWTSVVRLQKKVGYHFPMGNTPNLLNPKFI